MNQVANYDRETGEISSNLPIAGAENIPLAVQLAQVELNQAVTTAHAFPRSMQRARDNITALVMLDEETAAECIYALPRGGKPIKGPSVRFAEIIASQYGNCHVGSRVIEVNKFEKYVEAEGVFHDLETGMKRTARTRRRIVDSKGRLYNDDMILVTSNAACSIALREAILKGVPKALWRKAYDAADAVISGDVKTLSVRRADALKAFATFGITADQVFASLDVAGPDEITPDHIGTLTAMFKAIKSGEVEVEEYFPAKADAKAAVGAAKGTAGKLADIAGSAKAGDTEKPQGGKANTGKAENGHSKLADGGKSVADQRAEEERAHYAAEAKKADREKAAQDRHAADREEAQRQHEEDKAQRREETPKDEGGADPAGDAALDTERAASEQETGASGDAGAEDEGDGRPPTDEEVENAYKRGVTAGKRGMKPSLCPAEYRAHQRLFDAWNDGHAEGVEEAKAGSGGK